MTKKTVWIIGASHGIGEALAQKYFNAGFDVAISARSVAALEEIRREIYQQKQPAENEVLVTKLDVCDAASLQTSLNQIIEKFSQIDLVIFAAAIYQPSALLDSDLSVCNQTIAVNLGGAFNLLHVILPQMTKQKFGHLAFIASVAGYRGLPKSLAYGASKAGLINLCEGIYPELKRQNIDLSVINPGFVKTRLTDKNSFSMPFIITPQKAAEEIFNGLALKKFEIHFPRRFTYLLKILRILPNWLFLKLICKIK